MHDAKTFIDVYELARRTGLPIAWLRCEARSNRIPHIKVGRRRMFNPDTVEQVLIERAQVEASA